MKLRIIGNNYCPENFNYYFGTYISVPYNKIIERNIKHLSSFERVQLLYNILFLRNNHLDNLWIKNPEMKIMSKRLQLIWQFCVKYYRRQK